MLKMEKKKRVTTNWCRLRQENKELTRRCKKLSKHVDNVKIERDILGMKRNLMKVTLREHISWFQKDVEKAKKHDDNMVEVIERSTDQVKVFESCDTVASFHSTTELQHEFLKGVKACRDKVGATYPDIKINFMDSEWDLLTHLWNYVQHNYAMPPDKGLVGSSKIRMHDNCVEHVMCDLL